MAQNIFMVIFSLAFILFSCVLFTNSVEWFGKKLNLSQGVVGSILAAVGTALPETIIPIIAILFYGGREASEIGVGAIAGAPFMLSTLAFLVTGGAVIIYSTFGKRTIKMNANASIFKRDLTYFIVIYSIAVFTSFLNQYNGIRVLATVILLLSYAFYIMRTFSGEQEMCEDVDTLYFTKLFNVDTNLFWIILQLGLSLFGIIYGAHMFVGYVKDLSNMLGISPLILSIIITPVATELPEKLNSIVWIGQKKDTLALGNITGAMVFQSSIPVAIGILLTPWNLSGITLLTAILALLSAIINLVWVKAKKAINPFILMLGGILYAVFLIAVLR